MKCISSPALDDTEIVSYVEGEASDAVMAHIKECPFCSERARRWTLLQNRLRRQLYRVTCPTPVELGDYHLGLLPAPQMLVIAQHLRECALCRRELADLENFLDDLAPEVDLLGAAKVLIARLIGGSGKQDEFPLRLSSIALRGEAKGPITLEVDGIVIVLEIQPTNEGRANIIGQVAADDQEQWTGALVELRQDHELQSSTTLNDLGGFRSEGITPGSKELRITRQDSSLIVVSNFEIPA